MPRIVGNFGIPFFGWVAFREDFIEEGLGDFFLFGGDRRGKRGGRRRGDEGGGQGEVGGEFDGFVFRFGVGRNRKRDR